MKFLSEKNTLSNEPLYVPVKHIPLQEILKDLKPIEGIPGAVLFQDIIAGLEKFAAEHSETFRYVPAKNDVRFNVFCLSNVEPVILGNYNERFFLYPSTPQMLSSYIKALKVGLKTIRDSVPHHRHNLLLRRERALPAEELTKLINSRIGIFVHPVAMNELQDIYDYFYGKGKYDVGSDTLDQWNAICLFSPKTKLCITQYELETEKQAANRVVREKNKLKAKQLKDIKLEIKKTTELAQRQQKTLTETIKKIEELRMKEAALSI